MLFKRFAVRAQFFSPSGLVCLMRMFPCISDYMAGVSVDPDLFLLCDC